MYFNHRNLIRTRRSIVSGSCQRHVCSKCCTWQSYGISYIIEKIRNFNGVRCMLAEYCNFAFVYQQLQNFMASNIVQRILRLPFVLLGISTMLSASAEIPDGAIPFEYHNHLYIPAILQDTMPVSLIFDTGASHILVDKDFDRLSNWRNAKDNKSIAILGGAGNSDKTSYPMIVEPLKISMGKIKYKDEYSPVINHREALGKHVDLMVGNEAFANKIILINYLDEYILPVKKLTNEVLEGFTQLPATFKDNRMYIDAELMVDSIQSVKGRFLLDLGCGTSLVLTNSVRETLDFNNKPIARYYTLNYGLGRDGTTMIFRAKSFKLLDELDNVVVSASYNTQGALAGSDKYVGLLGNPILCHYDLIIDYVHKELYARKNNNPDDDCFISSSEQMRYLDRTDICDGWIVSSLFDNGIAQQAGFEIGDIILSINGRLVKDITWEEQRKGLGLKGRTSYEVKKKNGEIVTYILDIDKEII